MTKGQWVDAQLRLFVKNVTKSQEARDAADAARTAREAEVELLIG